jgi:hypothetical protein
MFNQAYLTPEYFLNKLQNETYEAPFETDLSPNHNQPLLVKPEEFSIKASLTEDVLIDDIFGVVKA